MTHGPVAKKNEGENAGHPTPPDGGWGWAVVFASFAIHIIADGMTYSFGLFYVEFLDYFNEGKGYTAWIASILVGVTLCSGPISSAFVNKYGCRPVTIAGAILAGFCLVGSCFAQSVFTLIITVGIGCGFGFGLIYLPAIVSVTMYFEKYRSLATGIAVCGSGFGTFIFAPLTENLIATYGWRGAMLIIAGIVLNCAIFGALFRPLENDKTQAIKMNDLNNTQIQYVEGDEMSPLQRSNSLRTTENNNDKQVSNGKLGDLTGLTVSQPLLNDRSPYEQTTTPRTMGSGIMYKPDILYRGSTHNLARSKNDLGSRYGSTRLDRKAEMTTMCGCIPCSQETSDTFTEMMDLSLLKDPIFIIFTLSNFLTSVGFNIPYVYLAAQAEVLELSKVDASHLLSIIGVANTVGRIILGYVSDKPWTNRLLIYNVCLTSCGIATALSVYCYDFLTLGTYSFVFGFTIGAYVGLTSVILVDLLGLERLTNAFGVLLLFQGIASLVGPPFAGWLYDVTGKYEAGFILSGVTIGFSGIILFSIPPIQRYLAKRGQANLPN